LSTNSLCDTENITVFHNVSTLFCWNLLIKATFDHTLYFWSFKDSHNKEFPARTFLWEVRGWESSKCVRAKSCLKWFGQAPEHTLNNPPKDLAFSPGAFLLCVCTPLNGETLYLQRQVPRTKSKTKSLDDKCAFVKFGQDPLLCSLRGCSARCQIEKKESFYFSLSPALILKNLWHLTPRLPLPSISMCVAALCRWFWGRCLAVGATSLNKGPHQVYMCKRHSDFVLLQHDCFSSL